MLENGASISRISKSACNYTYLALFNVPFGLSMMFPVGPCLFVIDGPHGMDSENKSVLYSSLKIRKT